MYYVCHRCEATKQFKVHHIGAEYQRVLFENESDSKPAEEDRLRRIHLFGIQRLRDR